MDNMQKRRTREEMFPVVESWQESGLSKTVFCKERGIIKSVFFYWCKRYQEENDQGGFIALTPGGHILSQGQFIEIQYPNGVVLKLPANTPASHVLHYAGQ